MVKGDIERAIDGAYHFRPDGEGGTYVKYDLAIELATPLPGFVKRRAEVRILNTIRELKARAESWATAVPTAWASTSAAQRASAS